MVAAGAAVAVAADRTVAKRRRDGVSAAGLGDWPVDRSGRLVADDGICLYYEENGPDDAPLTVVFVHGYCLSMGEFTFQRRALLARFGADVRFVFYDQRSHGRSDHSDPERVHNRSARCAISAAVLDTLAPTGSLSCSSGIRWAA